MRPTRSFLFLAVGTLLALGATGCDDEPAVTPTPDATTSDTATGDTTTSDVPTDAGEETSKDLPDTSGPTVTLVPGDGQTLGLAATIVATFSETIDRGSLDLTGDLGTEGVYAWSTTTVTDDTLTVAPATTWTPGTGLTLSISATNLAGNAMVPVTASYDVEASPDTVPPVVIDEPSKPVKAAEALAFKFNEAMDTATLTLGGTMAPESDGGSWSTDGRTLTVTPTTRWARGNGKDLTIAVSDLAGNALAAYTFATSVGCSDATDCGVGAGCADSGQCDSCDSQYLCAGDDQCAAGVCVAPVCVTTSDCSGGQVCVDFDCVACTDNDQCDGGQICDGGACGACTSSAQCGAGNICAAGSCGGCGGDDDTCTTYYGADHACSDEDSCVYRSYAFCENQGASGCTEGDVCTVDFAQSSYTCGASSDCGGCAEYESCIKSSDGSTQNCAANVTSGTPLQ